MMGFLIMKNRINAMVYNVCFTLIAYDNIVRCEQKYTKRKGQRKPDFLDLYFEFRGLHLEFQNEKYTI